MAPNLKLIKNLDQDLEQIKPKIENSNEDEEDKKYEYKLQIVWRNVIIMGMLHLLSLYGLYLAIAKAKWQTDVFAFFLYILSGLGITAGAHRLWSHRSYKAKFPLRIFLMLLNSIAFQNDIFEWSRDHRVHHKHSETDADPHNANRGFFFSHVGWLLCRKHPAVIEKGKKLDLSDLLNDPVVRFQKRYYLLLVLIYCFIMPTAIPMYFWGESFFNSYCIAGLLRYCVTLNMTWLVNSAAHAWGNRPYDKHISPTECIPTILGANGEGYHNFHHTFPWDYSASELGTKLNITTMFINFFAMLGQAYDLKTASKAMVRDRKLRTGDCPHLTTYKFFY